jgi:hypothetical protein
VVLDSIRNKNIVKLYCCYSRADINLLCPTATSGRRCTAASCCEEDEPRRAS